MFKRDMLRIGFSQIYSLYLVVKWLKHYLKISILVSILNFKMHLLFEEIEISKRIEKLLKEKDTAKIYDEMCQELADAADIGLDNDTVKKGEAKIVLERKRRDCLKNLTEGLDKHDIDALKKAISLAKELDVTQFSIF